MTSIFIALQTSDHMYDGYMFSLSLSLSMGL
jgi:hypothetical protein